MNMLRSAREHGFTLIEVVAVLGLLSVVSLIAISNIKVLENPLTSASSLISHHFRLVRGRAISQTRSIRVKPSGTKQIIAEFAQNCSSETFTALPELTLKLDNDVALSGTTWSICFTQRGLVDDAVNFTITSRGASRRVDVALGGGVRVR
jgi:prepilin-type N-terminal cleavage/methylation domain-containing protein